MSVNFQNEAEVKEYLDNIGIEYRFGCYSEKKADVCHLLADYLEAIHKDYGKARKIYRSTCDDYGYAKSCLKYANYTFLGRGQSGMKPNPDEALKYYEKGCTLNDSDSCLNAGLLYVSPQIQSKRNFPKGIELLTKGCDMNNGDACFHLSTMLISGAEGPTTSKDAESKISSTIPSSSSSTPSSSSSSSSSSKPTISKDFVVLKDMEKAFSLTYKACELNNMFACANLSQMYARGEGTEANADKAEQFRKKAIQIQDEAKNSRPVMFQQTS